MHWIVFAAAVGLGALAARHARPWLARRLEAPGTEAGLRRETELDRRIDLWRRSEEPLERFQRLGEIVQAAHAERSDAAGRKLFMRFAAMQIDSLPAVAEELKAASGGRLPEIPAFGLLAAALEEEGRAAEALALRRRAEALGVGEGSPPESAARIERLPRRKKKSAEARKRRGAREDPRAPRRRKPPGAS